MTNWKLTLQPPTKTTFARDGGIWIVNENDRKRVCQKNN